MGVKYQQDMVHEQNDRHGWMASKAAPYLMRAWRLERNTAEHGVSSGTYADGSGRWFVRSWCAVADCKSPVQLVLTHASSPLGTPLDKYGDRVWGADDYGDRTVTIGPPRPAMWTWVHDEVEVLCWRASDDARMMRVGDGLMHGLWRMMLVALGQAHEWLGPGTTRSATWDDFLVRSEVPGMAVPWSRVWGLVDD